GRHRSSLCRLSGRAGGRRDARRFDQQEEVSSAVSSTESAPSAGPYVERIGSFERRAEELGKTSRLVSNPRGASFGAPAIGVGHPTIGGNEAAGPVAIVGAVAFFGCVLWHWRVIRAEDDALRMARVNLDARARVTFGWHALPDDGARFASDTHPYSSD